MFPIDVFDRGENEYVGPIRNDVESSRDAWNDFVNYDGRNDPSRCIEYLNGFPAEWLYSQIKDNWNKWDLNIKRNIAYGANSPSIMSNKLAAELFDSSPETEIRHIILAGFATTFRQRSFDEAFPIINNMIENVGRYEEEHKQRILDRFLKRATQFIKNEKPEEKLEIRSFGRLIKTEFDKASEKFVDIDVTHRADRCLFNNCEIAEDVTLRDIFILVNENICSLEKIIGNYCRQIVAEGVQPPDNLLFNNASALELYKTYYQDNGKVTGQNFAEFHGIELLDNNEKSSWSIVLCKANDIAHLPVVLNRTLEIYEEKPGGELESICSLEGIQYTLGEILYSIFWELSFFGPPSVRQEFAAELREDIESNFHDEL